MAAGLFVVGRNLVMGKVGDAMVAVSDQPIAAVAMGIDNSLLKTKTFGVSAMYTGVASDLSKAVPRLIACVFLMPEGIHGAVSMLAAKALASRSP
jgi:branched-chain amino acid transport system permease protein